MTIYRINDIYGAIQGEGFYAGVPMVILRLHGCGVGCPWCDTKETWAVDEGNRVDYIEDALGATSAWVTLAASEIAAYIRRTFPRFQWVMVTGGEPADQDLEALTSALHDAGFKALLETSGTALGLLPASFDWVCVSPKINMPGGREIQSEAMAMADEVKQVIGKASDIFILDQLLAEHPTKEGAVISLQPLSISKKATEICVQTVMERGWRLSLQLHKYISGR